MADHVLRLTGATLADPTAGLFAPYDLRISDGAIEGLYPSGSLSGGKPGREIDLRGCVLSPGFTDLHVHLREPGGEENETIETGLRAAAAGGFTTVCAMPNSSRIADDPEVIRSIVAKASRLALAELLPIAAATKGLAGMEITDMAALKTAGAAAFSDDGMPIADSAIMEEVLYRAKGLGLPVIDHCEDPGLKHNGLMHEGEISREIGLPGLTSVSEAAPIARDLLLARHTGARLHIAHISTREGVYLLGHALRLGAAVSAEATPHHLRLTDGELRGLNTNAKVSPPLRSEEHRQAVAQAVSRGVITCIATDHAPWSPESKARPFAQAPNGISGLETALAVAWDTLVVRGGMAPLDLLARFTLGPAAVLGRAAPSLAPGMAANLTAVNLEMRKEVEPGSFYSKGKNSPFAGHTLQGWPVLTIYQGKVVMERGVVSG